MEFYGLLGEKLSHSLSPQIHNRIFDLIGIEGAYKLFPIPKDKVKKVGESIKIFGIRGMNVTIPYKKEIMDQLDFISDESRKIGAVNTISLENGKLYGYNTDYYGFGLMLDISKIEVKDKRAVVLGTGGAAKAVVTYLQDKGVKELFVVSRNKMKNNWSGEVNLIDHSDLQSLEGDLLINTTPVCMYPNVGKSPVGENVIKRFEAIVDLIYNPRETELLRLAKLNGKKSCDGLYMLLGQAVKAQEIWQDMNIDNKVTNIIYEELNGEFN